MRFFCPLLHVNSYVAKELYQSLTTEVYRVDYKVIGDLYRKYPTAFDNVMSWVRTAQLKTTAHLVQDRLLPYVNKMSRNGQYVELYPEEYHWIRHMIYNFCDRPGETVSTAIGPGETVSTYSEKFDLVELGFNKFNQVCKIGLVLDLSPFIQYPMETNIVDVKPPCLLPVKSTTRYLFLCLGLDCGIKTLYVTPYFKDRYSYQGATYKTVREMEQLFYQ